MAGENEIEGRNRDGEQMHYSSTNLSSDWPFNGSNDLTNTSPTIWDHNPTNSQHLGAFCDVNLQNNATTSSSALGFRKGNHIAPSSWSPPNSAVKRADSGFIERAARLSSFSAGNFEDMMNPFGNVPESSLSPYSIRPVQGQPQDGFVNGFKSTSGEGSKDTPPPVDYETNDGSQPKHDARQGGSGFSGNNLPGEAEYSEGGQDETSNEGFGSKKRRISDQDTDYNQVKRYPQTPNEATRNNSEIQQKGDKNPNSIANKSSGKHGKQVSQSSDGQKEEYIHVRARRGQATNSHSLAERVRREKISERMKFLQELVPGCSKVTGKAVMLDEIINYVQSLQRQVEFLSMKLATVNPRMDFNIEGLIAKDMLESRVGPSGTLGFGADMAMAYAHNPSQMASIMQGGISGLGSSSDAVRRTINSHLLAVSGVYKDPSSQMTLPSNPKQPQPLFLAPDHRREEGSPPAPCAIVTLHQTFISFPSFSCCRGRKHLQPPDFFTKGDLHSLFFSSSEAEFAEERTEDVTTTTSQLRRSERVAGLSGNKKGNELA